MTFPLPRTVAGARHTPPRSRALTTLAACGLWLTGALLAACGPGVGGTGTGSSTDSLSQYGAAPSNVCLTADFSPLLACGSAAAPGGTSAVFASDGTPTSRHLARFEGSRLTLELRCLNRTFEGEWASAGQLGSRYFGSVTHAGTGAKVTASVIVAAQGTTLVMLVQDFNGQRIGEPLLLQRVTAATTPAGC